MDIDEFLVHINGTVKKLCEGTGISNKDILRYRKKERRPSFHLAVKIIDFSNGLIRFEDIGWTNKGDKIPWTLKELEAEKKKLS